MKRSQYADQQIAFVLQQADERTAVPEVCRKIGISEATFHRWKPKYGGLMPCASVTATGFGEDRNFHPVLPEAPGAAGYPGCACLLQMPAHAQVAGMAAFGVSAPLAVMVGFH
ncbi:hypothetical protein E2C06_22830 [Dankookia rubra]|uniref:Transposase n=1 Tax=Dankookia rubra TaxID=1442381 RepID=A0A4R5QCC8_9PROT|nr:hypothetical protein E2C06_22830 [Dankookia rubra]